MASRAFLPTHVSVDRRLVGGMAVACGISAILVWCSGWEGVSDLWSGSLSRAGVVLAAVWLALPSRSAQRPLAELSLPVFAMVVLGLLILVRVRVPLRFLLPGLAIAAVIVRVLRPRAKFRPQSR